MHEDTEGCVRAVRSKDARFDGWFFSAVTTTGIYCRPSCPATPKASNLRFFPSAAAAQQAGFRACKRCRPDASPGSPEWDQRQDVAARAVRLIADGVVDRHGTAGLASRLGYSCRQIERILQAELGAGPLALARNRRAQTARILIETTTMPMADVAAAAGFASIRSFNETVQAVFALSPTGMRTRRTPDVPAGSGVITLRLPFRLPLHPDNLFGHLAATAVPGVEEWRDGAYRRTLGLPSGHGIVALAPREDHVECRLRLSDLRDLPVAVARCRRLLDLDADPVAVDGQLGADPALGPLVAAVPGRRVPRTVDSDEMAVRAVLGQQISTAAARTHAGRLAAELGQPVEDPDGELTRLFPDPATLADSDLARLAVPDARRRTVARLAGALAAGDVDLGPGATIASARSALAALPGIGPWTVETIAMRALGDPDAFPGGDLGVRAAVASLGLPTDSRGLAAVTAAWRPWRAYAVQHLWALGDHPVNHLPADGPPSTARPLSTARSSA